MRARPVVLLVVAGFATWGTWGVLKAQKPFRAYATAEQHAEFDLPPDYEKITEWTRARLIYRSVYGMHGNFGDGYRRWTIDYPRSDRLLAARHPAADAHRHPVGGADRGTGRHRRRLQLADAVLRWRSATGI